MSLAKAEEVSTDRGRAQPIEVTLPARATTPAGRWTALQNLLTKYNLDMLGAERVLRMLGGYAKNGGQMEKIAQMLNDGQYRQTKITIEGEKLFADVTGAKHAKEAQAFAGPGCGPCGRGPDRDTGPQCGAADPCAAVQFVHAPAEQGQPGAPDDRRHWWCRMRSCTTRATWSRPTRRDRLVQLGMLSDAHGDSDGGHHPADTLEAAMTDYDRAWCADMKEFFGNYTTKLINETSLQLVGYKRATVQNYYPIAVDKRCTGDPRSTA